MKIAHIINHILKKYEHDYNPKIEVYRNIIHDLISLEKDFFCETGKNKISNYLGHTDNDFIKFKAYHISDLEVINNKHLKNYLSKEDIHVKKVMSENGIRYIFDNKFGYVFNDSDDSTDNLIINNTRIDQSRKNNFN